MRKLEVVDLIAPVYYTCTTYAEQRRRGRRLRTWGSALQRYILYLMRLILALGIISLFLPEIGTAQTDSGFSGTWNLNSKRSDVRGLPTPPEASLKVEQSAKALTVTGQDAGSPVVYPLDKTTAKRVAGSSSMSTETKWEGVALLANIIVSGPQNYTIMERWTRSRDGSTLTIKRTVVRLAGESESILVYENAALPVQITAAEPEAAAPVARAARSERTDAPQE